MLGRWSAAMPGLPVLILVAGAASDEQAEAEAQGNGRRRRSVGDRDAGQGGACEA
jgi:hypothetical protein